MTSEGTGLTLPTSLPYPIRITQIIAQPSTSISRGSPIFEYTFTSATAHKALERQRRGLPPQDGDKDAREGDMVGSWDSELEGEVERLAEWVKVGGAIDRISAGKTVVWVLQACDHSVQFGGMCALCGADMTQGDYMTRPQEDNKAGPSKKQYAMTHDAGGVTVSEKEAKMLETQDQSNLLGARKLSLIVDLDQTIIHTTVEPTIGEWLDEIAADRAGSMQRSSGADGDEETTTPPGSPTKKEKNPNERALRDVARFQLSDDLPPGYDSKGKGKIPPGHERWYYTKPRPGLNRFLEEMNQMYEMHVYTMGTRSYADAICKAIDPEGKYFGTRILSRDESGSSFVKDLQRLFPTDRNMAVIIDDRADVWKNDLSNLVKVIPYDFFGIGDINASFLPPRTDQPIPSSPASSASTPPPQTPSSTTSPDTDVTPADENLIAKSKMLDELSESRPLAKMQEQLEKEGGASSETDNTARGEADGSAADEQSEGNRDERSTTPPGSPSQPRKPLLNPNDGELKRVGSILSRIHRSWYSEYDRRTNKTPGATLPLGCDVATIVSDLRAEVFDGFRFVFSGVIPLGTKAEDSEVWSTADSFGATVTNDARDLTITHCITATEGTEKVYRARRNGAKVVWMDWYTRCVALWERVDERDWLVLPPKQNRSGEESKGEASRPASGAATPTNGALGLREDIGTGEPGTASAKEDGGGGEIGEGDAGWGGLGQDELDALMREAAEAGDDDSDDGSNFGTEGTGEVPSSPLRSILGSPRASRAGSVESDASQPGTPKKRVRYADEEDLPLESFKDASPDDVEDRPKKRARALLMPPGEGDVVPDSNKFKYKSKGREVVDVDVNGYAPEQQEVDGHRAGAPDEASGAGEEADEDDEEDEFAALLHAETD